MEKEFIMLIFYDSLKIVEDKTKEKGIDVWKRL